MIQNWQSTYFSSHEARMQGSYVVLKGYAIIRIMSNARTFRINLIEVCERSVSDRS